MQPHISRTNTLRYVILPFKMHSWGHRDSPVDKGACTTPQGLGSIPGIHQVEGENQLPQVVL